MGNVIGFENYMTNHGVKVSQLDVGESGYLLPWQCKITPKGFFCVENTEIEKDYCGTRCVKITRVSDYKDGYDVDLTHLYESAEIPFEESNEDDIVIAKIINKPKKEVV